VKLSHSSYFCTDRIASTSTTSHVQSAAARRALTAEELDATQGETKSSQTSGYGVRVLIEAPLAPGSLRALEAEC
jgi:hypothetical protein